MKVGEPRKVFLTTQEVTQAEELCIRLVQRECFSLEIKELRKIGGEKHIEYKNVRIILSEDIIY